MHRDQGIPQDRDPLNRMGVHVGVIRHRDDGGALAGQCQFPRVRSELRVGAVVAVSADDQHDVLVGAEGAVRVGASFGLPIQAHQHILPPGHPGRQEVKFLGDVPHGAAEQRRGGVDAGGHGPSLLAVHFGQVVPGDEVPHPGAAVLGHGDTWDAFFRRGEERHHDMVPPLRVPVVDPDPLHLLLKWDTQVGQVGVWCL